jgi:hypothetical protein
MMDRTIARKVKNIRHFSMGEEYTLAAVADPYTGLMPEAEPGSTLRR